MKPATLWEGTARSTIGATRGKIVLRVSRRSRMNVGDPNGTVVVEPLPRESDMPVVVMITEKVKAEGAKGHYYK